MKMNRVQAPYNKYSSLINRENSFKPKPKSWQLDDYLQYFGGFGIGSQEYTSSF